LDIVVANYGTDYVEILLQTCWHLYTRIDNKVIILK
jgi:hypothetical protein